MTSTTPPPTATCAENIAFLYFLHSVPALPSRNPVEIHPICYKGYTLSFPRERSLTGTLAFLSNLKDGPDYIPAVCVEENTDSAFLNVLIAVNKARPDDGKEVLQNLKSCFERIFALLSRVSDGDGTSVFQDQIFTEIISMCSIRILCRLRLISNSRNTPKQPIKELLQEAVNSVRGLEKETIQNTLFVERAKDVIKLVDAWAKHRTPLRLAELVEGVYRLWRVGELQDLLSTIPNRIMDPTSRKNLLNTVSKVARYWEAARFLYRTAKKIPLVRKMKVVLVNLPLNAFQITPANRCSPSLDSTVSQISALHRQPWSIGQVCRLLKVSEIEGNNRFAKQTQKASNAKIHAEIQLVFYCELRASKLRPRVVCSTKDACFLCNAFIRMYEKIHTPRCHGRLYPGWRLPFSPSFEEIEQRFNTVLAIHIKNSLTALLSRQQKTVYPDPLESTLLTLPVSESTVHSLTLPEAVIKEEGEVLQPETLDRSETDRTPLSVSNSNTLSESEEGTSSASPATRTGEVSIHASNDLASRTVSSTLSSSRGPSSKSTSLNNYTLLQGQILAQSVKADHASPLYTTGPLEVQIEFTARPGQITLDSHSSNLSYSIEWLTVNEAEAIVEQNSPSLIDAESLEGEISHEIDHLNCLYITAQGFTLRILLQPSIAVGFKSGSMKPLQVPKSSISS